MLEFWLDHYLQFENQVVLIIAIAMFVSTKFIFKTNLNKHIVGNFALGVLIGPLFFANAVEFGTQAPYNIALFVITFDFLYYVNHRYFHRHKKIHFWHHKPIAGPLQSLDFKAIEFIWTPLTMLLVGYIFPISQIEWIGFLLFYFGLQLALHSDLKMQWPIFISPNDHRYHHTKHEGNYASLFKIFDKLFGTYYLLDEEAEKAKKAKKASKQPVTAK